MAIGVGSYVRVRNSGTGVNAFSAANPEWGRVLAGTTNVGPFTVLFKNFNLLTNVLLTNLDEITESAQATEDAFTGRVVRRLVTVGAAQVQATAEDDAEVVSVFDSTVGGSIASKVLCKTLQGGAYYEEGVANLVVLADR